MPREQKMPYEHERVAPPSGLRDLPRYLRELLGGFFTRFSYIVKLVWETGHWILFLLTFIAIFKGITPVIGSLISKSILNELQGIVQLGALPESDFWASDVFYLLIFLFVYRILLQIINDISRALNRIAGEKVVKQVKLQIMQKAKSIDIASFDDPEFYERMENANREAGNRPLTVLSETFSIVSTIIQFISYLVILMTAPGVGIATVAILLISVPSAIINFTYRKKNYRYMRRRSKERRQMQYYSNLIVDKDRTKEVRVFNLADIFIGRYLSVFSEYYKGLRRLILSENAWHTVIGVVSGIANLVFYILIAKQVFTGQIMIGDYSLYTGAIASAASCVSTLISTSGTVYEGTLFIDNLISFMNEPQTIVPRLDAPKTVNHQCSHTIEFKNVSFRYPGTERDILKNLSFKILPGETVALVGLNGAGKTTLIKLLMRLYDPTGGEILLDGTDLRDYDVRSLYETFGTIFQDFGKYAVTVDENIRFGDISSPTDAEKVKSAAEQSAAIEYIEQLPNGFETPLMRIFEPNGIELSIGQWQKLAIARAFYSDSDILILDEPTASLDPIAEQEIFNQFDCLREHKTSIFVSHRLSSATIADKIIVLEGGQLVELGSHRELMEKRGKYHELFSTQAKRYLGECTDNEDTYPQCPPGPPPRRPDTAE